MLGHISTVSGGGALSLRTTRIFHFFFFSLLSFLLSCTLPSFAFSNEKIVLRVANWGNAEEVQLEERIVSTFMRRNPDIEIQIESIPSNYREKILTSIAAGTVADVFLLDSPIIPALLNKDVLIDLMPHLDDLSVDLGSYFPNVLGIFRRENAVYAFPKDFTPLVIYYNKRMFIEEGIPFPGEQWTWDDYLAVAKKLTKDTDGDGTVDRFGTVFSNYLYLWQPFVWMAGGDIIDPEGASASGYFNSRNTERALQFLIDLRRKHKVSPHDALLSGISGGDVGIAMGMFDSGVIGMFSSGHWRLVSLKKHMESGELDVGVAPLPVPEGGEKANVIYAAGWCVPKMTRYPELAVKLAAFLASEEAALMRSEYGIGIPALKDVAREQVEADPYGVEEVFIRETDYGRQSWGTRIDEFSRIEKITQEAVEEVLIGGRDIHDAFTEAAVRIDDELALFAQLTDEATELKGNREIIQFLLIVTALAAILFFVGAMIVRGPERSQLLKGYSFIAPSFVVLLIFIVTPIVFSLYLSFHRWNVVSAAKPFVGFDNFVRLFHDRYFWNAFKNTAIYSLHVPVGMVISLAIALLMNRRMRGVTFLRTLFFLPSISSFVAIALVWKWMYHPQFGLANFVLRILRLPQLSWLSEPSTALISIMIVSIWLGLGYQMVIFLAGLQGIPRELYEAAITDGAGAWQRFRHITLPLLRPTTFFVLVTSIIGSFQVFAQVYIMTAGGPMNSTDVVVFHIYRNAWDYLKMGYASAMSWILFLVIVVVTWLQFRMIGRTVEYR